MDYKFTIFQKEGLSFLIRFKEVVSWEDYYLSIVIKYSDDKKNTNTDAPYTSFLKMDTINFSAEDIHLIRNGQLPIKISGDKTDIEDTDYVLQVKVTNEDNSLSFFILQADLSVKFDYEKR